MVRSGALCVALSLAVVTACGGKSDPAPAVPVASGGAGSSGAGSGGAGSGGAGSGGAGSGGAGSGGAGSGGAGSGGGPAFPPSCITALHANCPYTGACTSELAADGRVGVQCFASGVSVEYEYSSPASCMPGSTTTSTWYDDTGALCLMVVMTQGPACESQEFEWRDAGGAVVARGSRYMGTTSTVACETGETASCAPSSPACRIYANSCTAGTCP